MTWRYALTAKGLEIHIEKRPGRSCCGRQIGKSVASPGDIPGPFDRICWTCLRWAPPESGQVTA